MEQPPNFFAQRESSGMVCHFCKSLLVLSSLVGPSLESSNSVVQPFDMNSSEENHSGFLLSLK